MSPSDLPEPPALDALLAEGPMALFLDFDGTLVEIAETPDTIVVPGDLVARICALEKRLGGRLAVVSGRALDDLEKHTGALPVACAGSHGSDRRAASGGTVGEPPVSLAHEARQEIADFAERKGFSLEEKTHGAALHYRADPSLEQAGLAFAEELAEKFDLKVKRGKRVIELVADGSDKASAVRAFMDSKPFLSARPVFIGDDVTDEDGMRAAADLGGFGIAVGERESDNARYALASPAAVHHWLDL
ncbi:MAG: trehalose-phosphatase [Alteraurantiacibacter sp.]